MLWHHHMSGYAKPVGVVGTFQRLLEDISSARGAQFRMPPIATESDAEHLTGFLESAQSGWHTCSPGNAPSYMTIGGRDGIVIPP